MSELNPHNLPTTPVIDDNLAILFERMNKIRTSYGKPMIVTSGLRTVAMQDQLIKDGKSTAVHSRHLIGAACDILDDDGALHKWCKENEAELEKAELWLEERQGNWQHFQILPPFSGHRWFKP